MMSTTTETDYVRVRLEGILTAESPCHFGNGEPVIYNDSDSKDKLTAQPVCLDKEGKPYIPSATLKGALRDRLQQAAELGHCDRALVALIFGDARKGDAEQSQAGRLRIEDAFIEGEAPVMQTRTHVAIDPITATAADHRLFAQQLIPAGTGFKFICELEQISAAQLNQLRALLATFDGSEQSSVGKGKSCYYGRLSWQESSVQVIDQASLTNWLLGHQAAPYNSEYKLPVLDEKVSLAPRIGLDICIKPQGPLLINRLTQPAKKGEPDLEFQRTADGHLLIPSTSVRGLLRGHCSKILRTMADSQTDQTMADKVADSLLNDLFGSTKQRSPLWVGDAISDNKVAPQQQTFNAIDRFSGAVADGALYTVEGARAGLLNLQCSICPQWLGQNRWARGLALLLLRDAMEGDLAIGWGKSKGYGALRASLKGFPIQQNWLEEFKSLESSLQSQLTEQVVALEKEIKDRIAQEAKL